MYSSFMAHRDEVKVIAHVPCILLVRIVHKDDTIRAYEERLHTFRFEKSILHRVARARKARNDIYA